MSEVKSPVAANLATATANEDVTLLSGELKNRSTIEQGTISIHKDAFYETLPADLDKATVDKVFTHKENVVAAVTLLAGEVGEEQMLKDKALQSVSAEMKFGRHGDVTASYNREQTGRKSVTDPTEVTRYGTTSIRVREMSGKPRGELKKVRTMLSDRATSLFGK